MTLPSLSQGASSVSYHLHKSDQIWHRETSRLKDKRISVGVSGKALELLGKMKQLKEWLKNGKE